MVSKNYKDSKEQIIAKCICDRDFDVPDWIFEMVNKSVISNIITMTSCDSIFDRYLKEKSVRDFFDKVKSKSQMLDKKYVKLIYDTNLGVYSVLTLNPLSWKKIRNIIHRELLEDKKNNTENCKFIQILNDYLLADPRLKEYTRKVLKVLNLDSVYLVSRINKYLVNVNKINERNERVPLLIELLDIKKDYEMCQKLLDMNIPIFFNTGDISDLYRYMNILIDGKWRSELIPEIKNVNVSENDQEIIQMIRMVYLQLNNQMIVYAKDMLPEETFTDTFFVKPCSSVDLGNKIQVKYYLNKHPVEALRDTHRVDGIAIYGIKDFNDLIKVFGKNPYGLPLWVQLGFVTSGGDIRTLFGYDELLPEASIIKTEYQLNYLISVLPIEDIRFLLYNSPEFVKVLLTNDNITSLTIIKVMKALFENPINEELWNVLNQDEGFKGLDYRETIIRKSISYLTLNGLFTEIPESMLYLCPDILFVARNLSESTIPYIPVSRLVPYLLPIIKNRNYIKLNRYSEGEYISIDKLIDVDELVKNIVKYKKYGYIGDIITDDYDKLIDEIYKQSN